MKKNYTLADCYLGAIFRFLHDIVDFVVVIVAIVAIVWNYKENRQKIKKFAD
jgi:hypothetical protein